MIVLFEEYKYLTEDLKSILGERYYSPMNNKSYSKTNYVGYYFDPSINEGKGDVIIILPKVFLDTNDLAFSKYSPIQLLNFDAEFVKSVDTSNITKFIFEVSTWLYRSINQYKKRRPENIISENQHIGNIVTNIDKDSSTELDIILSIVGFYKGNKQLFSFIARDSNSHKNKINWSKTINNTLPIIKNNKPIYLNLKTTSKKINDDEELLIIFYSTLNFIKNKYFFEFKLPQNYELIEGRHYERLLDKGCSVLKRIKYKYFSDKMKIMYNLLYVFFERSGKAKINKLQEEVLLAKDFHIIFEDMVDSLISDDDIDTKLKKHKDGKEVDHIYRDSSFFKDDDIYYIGDSKYYKAKSNIGTLSKAKQFTYAKNVIQFNIDLFNKSRLDSGIRYRDTHTEGYNITPNFFISAMINNDLDFHQSNLENINNPILNFHFKNRLFDRDTLILQSYKINFLFLLSCYISKNQLIKSRFKKEARSKFREDLISHLNSNYKLYKITPKSNNLIEKHFKLLNGKVYKPSGFGDSFVLALEEKDSYREHNESLLKIIDYEEVERINYYLA